VRRRGRLVGSCRRPRREPAQSGCLPVLAGLGRAPPYRLAKRCLRPGTDPTGSAGGCRCSRSFNGQAACPTSHGGEAHRGVGGRSTPPRPNLRQRPETLEASGAPYRARHSQRALTDPGQQARASASPAKRRPARTSRAPTAARARPTRASRGADQLGLCRVVIGRRLEADRVSRRAVRAASCCAATRWSSLRWAAPNCWDIHGFMPGTVSPFLAYANIF
jgi:hypothetical protein